MYVGNALTGTSIPVGLMNSRTVHMVMFPFLLQILLLSTGLPSRWQYPDMSGCALSIGSGPAIDSAGVVVRALVAIPSRS